MASGLPTRTHTYRHHQLDSTRWDGFPFRDGDVVISTSIKAGTTWMQRIVSLDADDLDLYEANATRTLTPDLRAWLEGGRGAFDPTA